MKSTLHTAWFVAILCSIGSFCITASAAPIAPDHPLVVQAGLSWGDTFQVIYITDLRTDATNPNAAYYNNLVQTDATNQGFGDINWNAIVATVNDPLGPSNTPQSAQVILSDGTFFRDIGELYTPPGQPGSPEVFDLSGMLVPDATQRVWTGISSFGGLGVTIPNPNALGTATPSAGAAVPADNNTWWQANQLNNSNLFPLYGLSQELTVTPEPTSLALWSLISVTGIAVGNYRSRKRRKHI